MRRTIAAIGRTLVTVGLLILLFVTYELWGTGIHEARAQHDLRHQFAPVKQKSRRLQISISYRTNAKPNLARAARASQRRQILGHAQCRVALFHALFQNFCIRSQRTPLIFQEGSRRLPALQELHRSRDQRFLKSRILPQM